MKRPFLWMGLSFALGILFSRTFSLPPKFTFYALLTLLPMIPFYKKKILFLGTLLIGFFLLGGLVEGLDRSLPNDHIARFEETGKMVISGKILSLPEVSKKGKREMISFVLDLRDLYYRKELKKVSGKIQVFLFNPNTALEYGDEVRLWGELKTPEAKSNPGQFDYRRYLENEKIHRIFMGFGSRSVKLLQKGKPSFLKWVFRVRLAIKERIDYLFSFPENEVLSALLIGMRKKIPESIQDDFARTGTTHILAVSGLNVSIVGGLLYFLMRLMRLPRKLNALVSLVCVTVYVLISGYNAPVMRAGIMGGILMGGLLIDKESDLLNSLAIAFFALLFFKPQNLFSAGFQLSFISVFAIFLVVPPLKNNWFAEKKILTLTAKPSFFRKISRFYQDIFLATVAASLGTFPLILYYFRIASPISLLANLAIVPLMNFATFVGFLALPLLFASGKVSFPLILATKLAIKVSLLMNHLLAKIPFASFYFPSPPLYVLWVYYVGVLSFLLLPKHKKEWIRSNWAISTILVSAIIFGILISVSHRDDSLRIHILRLKQGRVIFLEFPSGSGNLLVNTGKGKPQEEWKWVVKPFLMGRGVQNIQTILLGSFYEKDIGGLEGLIESFRCQTILIPSLDRPSSLNRTKVLGLLRRKRIKIGFLSDREAIESVPGVQLEWQSGEGASSLRVEYGGKSCLIVLEGLPNARAESLVVRPVKLEQAMTFEMNPHQVQVESFPLK